MPEAKRRWISPYFNRAAPLDGPEQQLIFFSPLWRRSLAAIRAMLALSSLALSIANLDHASRIATFLIAGFATYAIVTLIWRSLETAGHPVLALGIDTIFFLICAQQTSDQAVWFNSLFYVYLLVASALLYGWREVWVVVVVCMAYFQLFQPPPARVLMPILSLAGILACAVALEKKTLLERLSGASRETLKAKSDLEAALEEERGRIAADFHDGPLQAFISLQMRLEVMRLLFAKSPEMAAQELAQTQEIVKTQVNELRAFLRGMRPIEVEAGASLGAAIRAMVEEFRKNSGIQTTLLAGQIPDSAEQETLEVLQIVREALNNAQKHSKASRLALTVERVGSELEITVEDDGTGFPFSGRFTMEELDALRLGPASIKRRVRNLGGELWIESRPERGALLKVRVPA